MNKAIHKLTFLLLPAALLVACSQDDAPVTVEKENPDTPQFIVTRSTGQGSGGELSTIFQNGTEVGLSVQESSGYTNMKYEYRDGTLKSKNGDILWDKDVTSLTVDAYYPYRSDGAYANPSVLQDQSTEANYYLSDALHATGRVDRSSNSMSLDFEHRTAKVILKFAQAMNEVSILNQPLTTGTGAEIGNIKAYDANGDGKTWKACIIPQKGITGLTVNSKIAGMTYKATLNKDNFEAGKQYSYNMTNTPSYIDLSKGNVRINDDNAHIIIQSEGGTTNNNIIINGTPTVTIANLNININKGNDYDQIALYIESGAPTIILKGNNTLKSGYRNAGLQLGYFDKAVTSAGVTIQGDGTDNCSLTAIGSQDGAGIGTPSSSNCGDIAIKNCTVIASISNQGYGGPAGIGSGGNSTCGNITIENATVTSTGSEGGSGIGAAIANERSSVCGDITIKNSTIHATGGDINNNFGAAIGCGSQSNYSTSTTCGKISITLKKGQSKNEFLSNLTTGGKAEKVGRGGFNGSVFGKPVTITWHDFNGNPIN